MSSPDRYAVIGYPVKHSWSPFIHGLFAKQTGQEMTYRVLEAAPQRFDLQVHAFFEEGGKGLNVTVPHKPAAVAAVKYMTPRAQIAGAVNTIALQNGELLGDNTDGVGLVTDLERNLGFSIADKRILLLGAGGAARGVLAPLLAKGPALLHIANRTVERAQGLAREFGSLGELHATSFAGVFDAASPTNAGPRTFDLVLNATSSSLQDTVPPVDTDVLAAHTLCYDMAYSKEDTPFTRWAKEHGAGRAELGWGMLVEQAAESFQLWRGIRPDTKPALQAVMRGQVLQ
jgi:shikimate dehydrogenase